MLKGVRYFCVPKPECIAGEALCKGAQVINVTVLNTAESLSSRAITKILIRQISSRVKRKHLNVYNLVYSYTI